MQLKRTIKLPGFAPLVIYLHPARRGCEHFCFIGAFTDAVAAIAHIELYQVSLFSKLALAFGAVGVYLTHAEEALQLKSHHPQAEESES